MNKVNLNSFVTKLFGFIGRLLFVIRLILISTVSSYGDADPGSKWIINGTQSPDGHYALEIEPVDRDEHGGKAEGAFVSAFLYDQIHKSTVAEFSPQLRMTYRKPGPLYGCFWSTDGKRVAVLGCFRRGDLLVAFSFEKGRLQGLGMPDGSYNYERTHPGDNINLSYSSVRWLNDDDLWISSEWGAEADFQMEGTFSYSRENRQWRSQTVRKKNAN